MARPFKVGLSYFPLPTDVFHDPISKALRRSYGTVGVLTYLNIMCRVYGDGGYYHRFTDLDTLCADIAEDITNNHFSRVAAAVRESISTLIDYKFLDQAFFEKGLITGTEIQEQYVIAAAKTKRRIDLGVCPLVDPAIVVLKNRINSEKTTINSEETPINSELMPQRKEKVKDKEKEFHSFVQAREREDDEDENEKAENHAARRHYIGGIGKNKVMLSDDEIGFLLTIVSLDEFNRYVGIIADGELKGHHYTKKTHCQAILEMCMEDRKKVSNGSRLVRDDQ